MDNGQSAQSIKELLPDYLFNSKPTPTEFLTNSAAIREALELQEENTGTAPVTATRVLRTKYSSRMGCGTLEGLSTAANRGEIDRMEGLILRHHLGYSLKKAHEAVFNMEQGNNESLRNYTNRAINLWRGIGLVSSTEPKDLEARFQATKDRAGMYWIAGIRQPDLELFINKKICDDTLVSVQVTELKKLCREAEDMLERLEDVKRSTVLHPTQTSAKNKHRQLVAAMTPPSQAETENGRERWNPTQQPRRQQRAAEPQRPGDQRAMCEHCSEGTFTWGKGCDNPLCRSKARPCRYCQKLSFYPRRGCDTPGCQPIRELRRASGNGRAGDQ